METTVSNPVIPAKNKTIKSKNKKVLDSAQKNKQVRIVKEINQNITKRLLALHNL
ncbi:MAG: hypothetical protein LBE36_00870 [Flavobacteriaceae bacterium]|jgi:hypothetical protein|nr:hypothetical protein [Flavobacteriaceae bacterium]